MLDNLVARASIGRVTDPLARRLVRLGVPADAVTVLGTVGTVAGALWFFPMGALVVGTAVVTAFVLCDLLDGAMARARDAGGPPASEFGAVLDSTCDRISDGAVFAGLAWWCLHAGDQPYTAIAAMTSLVVGQVVSYVKARAEASGLRCVGGLVERAERLTLALVGAAAEGIGIRGALAVALWLLAVGSVVTLGQRLTAVYRSAAVAALPGPVAAGIFRAGADLAARRDGPGRRRLRTNLGRVLGAGAGGPVPDAALDDLVAEALRSYARYWCEAFRLPAMDPAGLHARVDPTVRGVEHLDAGLAAGRGVVCALTHSGNWDVAGVWLVRALRERGRPATFATVAERLRPESLHDRFVAYRESLGFEVLPADAGPRTTATLAARLRAGGVVCLVADRDLTGSGIEVDFFGAPARIPGGPAQLARHTGAALLPVDGWFTPDGWGLRFRPRLEIPDGPAAPAVATTTQALADAFARGIAAHPADWHMLQPIWTGDRVAVGRG